MSPLTLDYLARLGTWAALAAGLQGGVVWLSWAAWSRRARSACPLLRHRLACLHFAALALLPALTLVVLQGGVQASVAAMAHATRCVACRSTPGLWLAAYDGLRRLAWPAALLWSAGAALMAARLALAAWRLGQMQTREAPAEAVAEVARLAARWTPPLRLEVRQAAVDAPQVVGLRRPRLLLPPQFMERLAPAEREAVLLHELAHVACGDFGWNLVQQLTLAALWPHPAAWRLYARLRREREIRCDALALRWGATRAGLARALVRLAEERTAQPRLSMTLSGASELSARLHRLTATSGTAAPKRGLRFLAIGASAACVLAPALGGLGLFDPAIAGAYLASAFGPTVSIAAHDPAGTFALDIRHGRVIAARLGDSRLPPERIRQHGRRVELIGPAQTPAVSLTVSPEGEVRWTPRA